MERVGSVEVKRTPSGRGEIAIRRPPVNVLDLQAIGEIVEAVAAMSVDPEVRVILLHAEGMKCFSAGVDVADHTVDRVAEMLDRFHRLCMGLREAEIPVVAAVHGSALGGGMELAMSADITVAAENARFGQPEVKVGVFPPLAAVLYPRWIGAKGTMDLLFSGRTLDVAEAHRLGLVQRVFPDATFMEEARRACDGIASLSRPVLVACKRAIREGLDRPIAEGMNASERIYRDELMATADAREGLAAFLEKRKPEWRHR